jgi:hypothetical protein
MKKNTLLSTTLVLAFLVLASGSLSAADVKPADLWGKWIADSGNGPAQVFVLEVRGDKISGVTCSEPCDAARVFVIEDGSVTGDKITLYIRHEDRGEGIAKYGPYRDVVTGTIAGNEIHAQWHRDGGSETEAPHGAMVLIGPVRLLPLQPAAPAPPPPAK